MKRIFLFLSTIVFFTGVSIVRSQGKHSMFHTNGLITPPIQRIFNLIGFSGITTLTAANTCAQKNLLRQGERWHVQERTPLRDAILEHRTELIEELRLAGMIESVTPDMRQFKYALLLGGLHERFKLRIQDLEQLIHDGYIFSTIVLLSSDRPLEDFEKKGLPAGITTEAAMMRYEFDQTTLKNFASLVHIRAPMKMVKGKEVRATTDDTVKDFLKTNPEPGPCLVVSNNPYIQRQTAVARHLLPKTFVIEGFGRAVNVVTLDIVIALDEFARTLYQELQLSK